MDYIIVETSARHVHLTDEHLAILFGEGYELTKKKDLSQPGQFASNERVTIVGPKRELANVSILGPTRKQTQVELSLTDARSIGIVAPIRESGDLDNTPGCKIIGPKGEIEIESGVIAAKRHIHLSEDEAKEFDVCDKQIVKVKIESSIGRSLIFDDVVVRVNKNYRNAMHVDTDESNAAGLTGSEKGILIK